MPVTVLQQDWGAALGFDAAALERLFAVNTVGLMLCCREAARRMFGVVEDPEAAIAARVRRMWAMGATGKFIWPIPDKGLKKRIHRIRVPTLLIQSEDDPFVPPSACVNG